MLLVNTHAKSICALKQSTSALVMTDGHLLRMAFPAQVVSRNQFRSESCIKFYISTKTSTNVKTSTVAANKSVSTKSEHSDVSAPTILFSHRTDARVWVNQNHFPNSAQ